MNAATILVVEDEVIVAMDLTQHLETMGYTVTGTAVTGEEAIRLARAQRPALVLMDIMLQGPMNGIDAARHIGRELRIPVIFLTALNDAETVRRAAETAPYGYLTKPFQIRELRAAIEVALYKARMEQQLHESEQWFTSTLRCVTDAVIATDPEARVTFLNPAAEALTGWTLEEACGRKAAEILPLVPPGNGAPGDGPAERALREDRVIGIEHGTQLKTRDGKEAPVDDSAAPIRAEDGRLLGAVVVMRDVSDRLRQEERLRTSEERFRHAFELAAVGMALVALDGRFLQVNNSLCQLLGYEPEALLMQNHAQLTYFGDLKCERACLYQLLTGEAPAVQFEKRYLHHHGQAIICTLASVSLLRKQGEPLCYLYQLYDLSERKEAEYQLTQLAYYDPLTGLANRTRLREELGRMLAAAHRHHEPLAVAMIDLDRFKQINDSLGHEAGDELLKTVADRLKSVLRETDCAARLGGDEFVLVLPEVKHTGNIVTVLEKVRVAVSKPIWLGAQEVVVTPSIGVSLYPADGEDPQILLRNADSALFAAKAEGRNRAHFFRSELAKQAAERLELEAALRQALDQRKLYLEYQPILRLDDGTLTAFEALLRWRRDGGTVAPTAFISIAEETGLILPIGAWVLQETCGAAAAWPAPLAVHVNASAQQFREDGFADTVAGALKASGLLPHRLCLELTESVLLQESGRQMERLARLAALGIRLSIDDYGTGYSSLSYIKRYAPQSLKIDALFVRDLENDSNSAAIVSATIAMAHALGLEVVAEGVETGAQAARLRNCECDMAQGHYFSRPVAADEVAALIRAGRLPLS